MFAKAVAEVTDNKFQIQVFAAGEIVPGLQALDARQQRHRRDVPHRLVLLCRQGSDLRLRAAVPFGLNARQQNAWMYQGGGMELFNEFYKKFNVYGIPCGNTGTPDGRLVPQGDQDRRRPATA